MANRVVLGNLPGGGAGLRVSKPGVNVLTAGLAPRQIAFDSGWDRSMKVFLSGTVNVPEATAYPQYTTVNFGTTFSSPPLCLVWLENPTGTWSISGQVKFITQEVITDNSYWFNNAVQMCRIYTNRVEFQRFYSNIHGAYTARYMVLVGA